jgi:hypothetical protein
MHILNGDPQGTRGYNVSYVREMCEVDWIKLAQVRAQEQSEHGDETSELDIRRFLNWPNY